VLLDEAARAHADILDLRRKGEVHGRAFLGVLLWAAANSK
jgi:hypothetical protein